MADEKNKEQSIQDAVTRLIGIAVKGFTATSDAQRDESELAVYRLAQFAGVDVTDDKALDAFFAKLQNNSYDLAQDPTILKNVDIALQISGLSDVIIAEGMNPLAMQSNEAFQQIAHYVYDCEHGEGAWSAKVKKDIEERLGFDMSEEEFNAREELNTIAAKHGIQSEEFKTASAKFYQNFSDLPGRLNNMQRGSRRHLRDAQDRLDDAQRDRDRLVAKAENEAEKQNIIDRFKPQIERLTEVRDNLIPAWGKAFIVPVRQNQTPLKLATTLYDRLSNTDEFLILAKAEYERLAADEKKAYYALSESEKADYDARYEDGVAPYLTWDERIEKLNAQNEVSWNPLAEKPDSRALLIEWGKGRIDQKMQLQSLNFSTLDKYGLDTGIFLETDQQSLREDGDQENITARFGRAWLKAAEIVYDGRNNGIVEEARGKGAWLNKITSRIERTLDSAGSQQERGDAEKLIALAKAHGATSDQFLDAVHKFTTAHPESAISETVKTLHAELAKEGEWALRWQDGNLGSALHTQMNRSEEYQAAVRYLVRLDAYTQYNFIYGDDFLQDLAVGVSDPTQIISAAVSIGVGVYSGGAASAPTHAATQTARAALFRAMTAGMAVNTIEGFGTEAGIENSNQDLDLKLDVVEQKDYAAILMRGGTGAVMGATLGAGMGGAGHGIGHGIVVVKRKFFGKADAPKPKPDNESVATSPEADKGEIEAGADDAPAPTAAEPAAGTITVGRPDQPASSAAATQENTPMGFLGPNHTAQQPRMGPEGSGSGGHAGRVDVSTSGDTPTIDGLLGDLEGLLPSRKLGFTTGRLDAGDWGDIADNLEAIKASSASMTSAQKRAFDKALRELDDLYEGAKGGADADLADSLTAYKTARNAFEGSDSATKLKDSAPEARLASAIVPAAKVAKTPDLDNLINELKGFLPSGTRGSGNKRLNAASWDQIAKLVQKINLNKEHLRPDQHDSLKASLDDMDEAFKFLFESMPRDQVRADHPAFFGNVETIEKASAELLKAMDSAEPKAKAKPAGDTAGAKPGAERSGASASASTSSKPDVSAARAAIDIDIQKKVSATRKKLKDIIDQNRPDAEARIKDEVSKLEKSLERISNRLDKNGDLTPADRNALDDKILSLQETYANRQTRLIEGLNARKTSIANLADARSDVDAAAVELDTKLAELERDLPADAETQAAELVDAFNKKVDKIKTDNEAGILARYKNDFNAVFDAHKPAEVKNNASNRITKALNNRSVKLGKQIGNEFSDSVKDLQDNLADLTTDAASPKKLAEAQAEGNKLIDDQIAKWQNEIAKLNNPAEKPELMNAERTRLRRYLTDQIDEANTKWRADHATNVTNALASPRMRIAKPKPDVEKGSHGDSRTVAHFCDNISASVQKYLKALEDPSVNRANALKTFQDEMTELYQSLNRMGNLSSDKYKLSNEQTTIAFMSSGNITKLQQEGLYFILSSVSKMGDEFDAKLTSPAAVKQHLQRVVNRVNSSNKFLDPDDPLAVYDDFISAGWKAIGWNVDSSGITRVKPNTPDEHGNFKIGVTSRGGRRQLQYMIEEASAIGGVHRKLQKDANTENLAGSLGDAVRQIKYEDNPEYHQKMGKEIATVMERGITNADILYELNKAVILADGHPGVTASDPFPDFAKTIQQVKESLHISGKVKTRKLDDGTIEILDPYRAQLIDRLIEQNDRVWAQNPQGADSWLFSNLLGRTLDGSISSSNRQRRLYDALSLQQYSILDRYARSTLPGKEFSSSGDVYKTERMNRLVNLPWSYFSGKEYDWVTSSQNKADNPLGYSHAWKEATTYGKYGRVASVLYRGSGMDIVGAVSRSMPEHWYGAQTLRRSNVQVGMKGVSTVAWGAGAYTLSSAGAPTFDSLTYASPVAWTGRGLYEVSGAAVAAFDKDYAWGYFASSEEKELAKDGEEDGGGEVDPKKEEKAEEKLKEDKTVETVLQAAPFNIAQKDLDTKDVEAIQKRAAGLIAGKTVTDQKAAAERAAYAHYIAKGLEADGVKVPPPAALDKMAERMQVEGGDPMLKADRAKFLALIQEMDTRYKAVMDALPGDYAKLPQSQFAKGLLPKADEMGTAFRSVAEVIANQRVQDATTGEWSFQVDPSNEAARQDLLSSAVLAQLDKDGDGDYDQADVDLANKKNSFLSGLGYEGSGTDLSMTWNQTVAAGSDAINWMTDHDGDGYGVLTDTSGGRFISGTVQSVIRTATDLVTENSKTRGGRQFQNALMAAGGALFAPWILSNVPGFGWLNSRGFRPFVMIAMFFLGWKALNGGALKGLGIPGQDGFLPQDDKKSAKQNSGQLKRQFQEPEGIDISDEEGAAGEAQGGGGFIQKGIINVRTQPHDGKGLPQVISLEGNFDDDEELETINLLDLDRDGNFVAQLVDGDGSKTFVSPEMLRGDSIQGLLNNLPPANAHGVVMAKASSAKNLDIEFITKDGETTPSSFKLSIGDSDFIIPVIEEFDETLTTQKAMELESNMGR